MRLFSTLSLSALLLAPLAGCERSAGGYTHATAASEVSSEIAVRIGDGAPMTDRLRRGARSQECRGGAISLSIAPGALGDKAQPRLRTLYLKPGDLDVGRYPISYKNGRWQSRVALDGTLAPDGSRSIAPFGMEVHGTVDGEVTIERSVRADDGSRTVSGRVKAAVAGDPAHTLSIDGRFDVTWQPAEGCP